MRRELGNRADCFDTLAVQFLRHRRRDEGAALSETQARQLPVLLEAGRRAWPRIHVEAGAFMRYLAEHLPDTGTLEKAHGEDLYLAGACSMSVPGAIAAFREQYQALVLAAVARIDRSAPFADEVWAHMQALLFVASPEATAKIAEYAGQGRLATWVHRVALRLALNMRRDWRARSRIPGAAVDAWMDHCSPEPDFDPGREQHLMELAVALKCACRALSPQQRSVLKLHFADGLPTDEIGARLRIDRSTVTRRLANSRKAICDETRLRLKERLSMPEEELDGLIQDLIGQLDLNLTEMLGPARPSMKKKISVISGA